MSRYRGPRVKIIRRLGRLPGPTQKTHKKKPDFINRSTSSKKASKYRVRLEEKQKLRFHYGLTERQLLEYVRIARGAKGSTGQVSLQSLEMRSDNIILGLGMAPTIPGARQMVNHKHILVNYCTINIPSYRCKPKDIITMRNRPKSQAMITRNRDSSRKYKKPNHSTFHSSQNIGLVNQIIDREWIDSKIKELLVVEYHSRQA
uniref:Small ribosomal subunit protein uS4c n=1 Tax=Isoetes yunguiensis TaxID=283157 RepID=A0A411AEC1_9TRAC|nr:ribosomal protein S4 [Isoetes yunguiensis]QAX27839.1 ribosomal protein S4 [Isoetes yunguiensis]UQV94334.1 ribosomal protein S4 [Isoetes sp. CL-2022a]UQV94418.1 ribosomal protein S4 [Isoetes sp. CL-2022b]